MSEVINAIIKVMETAQSPDVKGFDIKVEVHKLTPELDSLKSQLAEKDQRIKELELYGQILLSCMQFTGNDQRFAGYDQSISMGTIRKALRGASAESEG